MMGCEPLSVLILSTCLIAFWPCILPLCFVVPILPYPMYFSKKENHESLDSNDDKIKINSEGRRKPEPPPVRELEEERKDYAEEYPERIGPCKGTLAPEKKYKKSRTRFDDSEESTSSDESEEECCTIVNIKDKNVGCDFRELDLECDVCGSYKASIYYDSDDYCDSDTEIDEIIVIPKKKPKMVNKQTKTNNKITKKGSGDKCTCNNKKFGRTT